MLTITSNMITTAKALIKDLMEWGLSSWLNMDIYFCRKSVSTTEINKTEIDKPVYFFAGRKQLLDEVFNNGG